MIHWGSPKKRYVTKRSGGGGGGSIKSSVTGRDIGGLRESKYSIFPIRTY